MKKNIKKPRRRIRELPKKCYFCEEKKVPLFSDIEVLRRFVTERGRIVARLRSGVCAKHHRKLSVAIKRARFLALLPFTARV